MAPSLSPAAETARLVELHSFGILDSPREMAFDRLTRQAARALGAPTALITLMDRDRQWFKSRYGFAGRQTSRDVAFCQYAIVSGEPLVVEDASDDPRFRANALVTNAPHIRFYAGVPLVTPSGNALGALCVLDYAPRTINADEMATLRRLAAAATGQIAMRAAVRDINAAFLHEHGASCGARHPTELEAALAH